MPTRGADTNSCLTLTHTHRHRGTGGSHSLPRHGQYSLTHSLTRRSLRPGRPLRPGRAAAPCTPRGSLGSSRRFQPGRAHKFLLPPPPPPSAAGAGPAPSQGVPGSRAGQPAAVMDNVRCAVPRARGGWQGRPRVSGFMAAGSPGERRPRNAPACPGAPGMPGRELGWDPRCP